MSPSRTRKPANAAGGSRHKTSAAGHTPQKDPAYARRLKQALQQSGQSAGNHCFGCAPGNRQGLQLRFQQNLETRRVECVFRLARRFEGPPGHAHGGIIATILDEAMSKANRQKGIVALTRHMSVDYLQPVPLGVKLCAIGWPVKQTGRKHTNAAEIRTLEGAVLARGAGLFVAIDPVQMLRQIAAGKVAAK
jgi:uncharacterized protein (TIGR00369 family)